MGYSLEVRLFDLQELIFEPTTSKNVEDWGIVQIRAIEEQLGLPGGVPIYLLGPLGEVPMQLFVYGSGENLGMECNNTFFNTQIAQAITGFRFTPTGIRIRG
jgi:hypothetical protein